MPDYYQPSFDLEVASSMEPVYEGARIPSVKPDGSIKWRQVWAPDEATRQVHRDLLTHLYAQDAELPYAYGAVPGRSVVDNVQAHREGWHFYMVDFQDAFPSVKLGRLATMLAGKYMDLIPGEVLDFLQSYFTVDEEDGLILGPPSSPYLFNLYCEQLDQELGDYTEEHGITYTRWIDDLTFSSPKDNGPIGKRKRAHIRDCIEDNGFSIAHKKSKVHSLDNGPVTITGISLYDSGLFRISPGLIEKVSAAFAEIEGKLDRRWERKPITIHDLGIADGYHSVLVWTRDPNRSGMTRIERELQERYNRIRQRLAALGINQSYGDS